ncbi:hypothetical protein VII00023_10924 [Vibrio ichthyoenteri ATCC 700023]|uniref:Uncharacterized protein n=1 Tax=Vibrio ichthyoenteri ATCC 700023 TaxID=870968 RepID=F9S840_9VIBR|nr:DUF3080 family protein [Vibrio ichthyoenteri]EGU30517.1 hypothetical protein VII00023_10924 [Vibrio ichthyoenteri ATCC 700023]
MPWLLIAILLFVTGCNFNKHPIESQFETYLERIANVQKEPALAPVVPEQITLPDKRALALPIETVTIGLLDSYELRKCGLFHLIAEKNSILGKVQDQFREFDYQQALILGIRQCLANVEAISEEQTADNASSQRSSQISLQLSEQLAEILSIKLAQQPHYIANLLFTSNAMREQLTGTQWLKVDYAKVDVTILRGMDVINQAYRRTLPSQNSHLIDDGKNKHNRHRNSGEIGSVTDYQEGLEKHQAIGSLLFSLHNTTRWLNTITQQLTLHDNKIRCEPNRDRTQFRYLKNVFDLFFAKEIQAYLALLDARYYELQPYLPLFQQAHPNYQYPLASTHANFRQATLEHVQYWQTLFARCGIQLAR